MSTTKFTSNVHIDNFIEKVSRLGVTPEDISDYLDYSARFEMSENIEEKLSVLDTLFLNFRIKYPNVSQDLEEDISQVYLDVLTFGNIDFNSIDQINNQMIKDILDRFQNKSFEGTFFDLGKEFGLIIGKYLNNKELGLREVDFISGLNNGFEIYKG